jgi:hypothetical protein
VALTASRTRRDWVRHQEAHVEKVLDVAAGTSGRARVTVIVVERASDVRDSGSRLAYPAVIEVDASSSQHGLRGTALCAVGCERPHTLPTPIGAELALPSVAVQIRPLEALCCRGLALCACVDLLGDFDGALGAREALDAAVGVGGTCCAGVRARWWSVSEWKAWTHRHTAPCPPCRSPQCRYRTAGRSSCC